MTKKIMSTCRDTFPTEFIYHFKNGTKQILAKDSTKNLKGIFDAEYIEESVLNGLPGQSTFPLLGVCKDDLLKEPGKGDKVHIGGICYSVIESRPDGEAGLDLVLNKD